MVTSRRTQASPTDRSTDQSCEPASRRSASSFTRSIRGAANPRISLQYHRVVCRSVHTPACQSPLLQSRDPFTGRVCLQGGKMVFAESQIDSGFNCLNSRIRWRQGAIKFPPSMLIETNRTCSFVVSKPNTLPPTSAWRNPSYRRISTPKTLTTWNTLPVSTTAAILASIPATSTLCNSPTHPLVLRATFPKTNPTPTKSCQRGCCRADVPSRTVPPPSTPYVVRTPHVHLLTSGSVPNSRTLRNRSTTTIHSIS